MGIWIYIVLIILMIFFAKILLWPMKLIIKLVINILVGGLIIWLINMFGHNFGIVIPFNEITAFIVGILGVPGAILIWIFNSIF